MKTKLFFSIILLSSFALTTQLKSQEAKEAEPKAFAPFNVGEIKPTGWLHDWAGMAARGLTKTLGEDFTEFVKGWESAGENGWWHYEQTGYYIDGVTRLGYILDDTLLMNRSKRVMETVAARQKPNGYIMSDNKDYVEKWGGTDADYGLYWSEAVFCRAALAYYAATGDPKVLDMLMNVYDAFPVFERQDPAVPFNGCEMDNLRKIVGLENMFEISRLTGDRRFADRALEVLKNFESGFLQSWVKEKSFMRTAICHGVTYNEVAKLCAVAYAWNHNPAYLEASVNAFEFLQAHFMLPFGSPSANEYLHGIGAFEATEACDISDFLWSNVWLARATGEARYGDRIEKDIFNALPTAVNAYFDHSVYTTAMNRIPGVHLKIRDDGQYYKTIHDPTCCSANINRALPNYIINMCLHNEDELLWLTYGPAHLQSKDGGYDIAMETLYPFDQKIKLTINALPKGKTLLLRVPEWCESPSIKINGKASKLKAENGFFRIERKWKQGDVIELVFPMLPSLETGTEQFADFNGTQPYWGIMEPAHNEYEYSGFVEGGRYGVVHYGPLVLALSLQEKDGQYYELNEERWHEFRYALDENSLKGCAVTKKGLPTYFRWSKDVAPVKLSVTANLVDWNPDKGDPKLPLDTPKVLQDKVELELIPIGCAPYRLAMFPFVTDD